MKHCPKCQSTYTDDTLQFCLQDGTSLIAAGDAPSNSSWNESETIIRQPPANRQPVQANDFNAPEANDSKTGLTILLTALATLIIFGLGFGGWYFLRNRENEIATGANDNLSNRASPKPANVSNVNNAIAANTNTNRINVINAASPSPSPSNVNKNSKDSPMPPDIDVEEIKGEAIDEIRAWQESFDNLDNHLSHYADRLDYYYNARNVSLNAVRRDKQRAFDLFRNFRVTTDEYRVTTDQSGRQATAVFDKEWQFEGDGRRNAGKTQSQLQFTKINGEWKITGERDLKVYYLEK